MEAVNSTEDESVMSVTSVSWMTGKLAAELHVQADETVKTFKERLAAVDGVPPSFRQRLVADTKVLADDEIVAPHRNIQLVDVGGNGPSFGTYSLRVAGYISNGQFGTTATLELSEEGSVDGAASWFEDPPEGYGRSGEFKANGKWRRENGKLILTWSEISQNEAICGGTGYRSIYSGQGEEATWDAETDIITWMALGRTHKLSQKQR
eukprot:TRINITY_DN2646_c0_g1_i1.p1 TRINITY_DN2646_c0_g1~~TRINITY_DN2646_c0_g1_i1.p1  ORF type:complete len:229 (+),score=22.94 TRINITY_DN2646_c0_g1_i1:66-689(+)